MNVHYLNLDAELRDPDVLQALVIDGIVDIPTCEFPKSHATKAAPYWHADGRPACSICHPPRREEEEDARGL